MKKLETGEEIIAYCEALKDMLLILDDYYNCGRGELYGGLFKKILERMKKPCSLRLPEQNGEELAIFLDKINREIRETK